MSQGFEHTYLGFAHEQVQQFLGTQGCDVLPMNRFSDPGPWYDNGLIYFKDGDTLVLGIVEIDVDDEITMQDALSAHDYVIEFDQLLQDAEDYGLGTAFTRGDVFLVSRFDQGGWISHRKGVWSL